MGTVKRLNVTEPNYFVPYQSHFIQTICPLFEHYVPLIMIPFYFHMYYVFMFYVAAKSWDERGGI